MKAKGYQNCWECGKSMERCRAVTVHPDGSVEWCCRRCWRDLEMERYLYKHRTEPVNNEVERGDNDDS